jgi:hypothetical protein
MSYSNQPQPKQNHWQNAGRSVRRLRHQSPALLWVAFALFGLIAFCLLWALSVGAQPFTKAVGGFGLIVYILCQFGQLLWIMIALDRYANQAALSQVEELQSQQGKTQDEFLGAMQEKVSKIPFAFIALSGWIALGCYVFESIVNWSAMPFITDFEQFRVGLLLGKLIGFDSNSFARYVFSLLSVEGLATALIVVWFWISAHREGKKAQP